MKTRNKRLAWVLTLSLGLGLFSGCTTWDKMTKALLGKNPGYILHIHSYTGRRTDENEMNSVEYTPGKFVYLDKKPLLTSINASGIEVIDRPRGKSLKLTLDGHGRTLWTQATARNRGKRLIVMLDKTYKGWISIERIEERGILVLPGPFSEEEVENIQDNAEKNRKKF
jgi:preprotein translocase subunit SecD